MTEITRVVARAHPGILTAVYVVGGFASLIAPPTDLAPAWRGLLMALFIAVPWLWYWAVYVVASASRGEAAPLGLQCLFAVPPVLVLVAESAGWPMDNSPVSAVFFVVLFIALGVAAQALENADAPTGYAPVGRILGTTLLMFLAPIGVWVLWVKIRRVEGRRAVRAG